jgi:uncharacterized protein YneR
MVASMMKRLAAKPSDAMNKLMRMSSMGIKSAPSSDTWLARMFKDRSIRWYNRYHGKLIVEEVTFPMASTVSLMQEISYETSRPGVTLKAAESDRMEWLKKEQIPIDEAPQNQSSG